ncbi:DUF1349 domain-containing protein, partial [Klebsiella pneumoniae]
GVILGSNFRRAGDAGPLLRPVSFRRGAGKAAIMCGSPGGGRLVFVSEIFQLPPPLDKALHDLS